jgi:class 3 adenylate cyclase
MPTQTLSIMLVDLVGSTRQVTQVDAVRAAEYLEDATRPIEALIERHKGTLVKFMGDGFLCTFKSARHALVCADAIRDHFIRQRYTPSGLVVDGVRVVVHTGDVVCEGDDVLGDAVIVCSRLEKSVPTNQVWLTAATREVVGISDFVFQEVGEIQLRGRSIPVMVYALENTEMSFIEHGTVLLVTDLHRYIEVGEELSAIEFNDWVATWSNLHRDAVMGLKSGHIRQFVADRALISFANADDAVQSIINLHHLVTLKNRTQSEFLQYQFKAALASGDLILSPTGIAGRVVNRTFSLLNATPRQSITMDIEVFERLSDYRDNLQSSILPAGPKGEEIKCYQFRIPDVVE